MEVDLTGLDNRDEPAWLDSLYSALGSRRGWGRFALDLLAAFAELRDWLRLARQSSWERSSNRRSLAADIEAAVATIGEGLRDFLEPELTRLVADALKILQEREATKEERSALADRVSQVIAQLEAPEALRAAWDDLLSAHQDLQASTLMLSNRLGMVQAIAERTGRDWKRLASRLKSLLEDSAAEVRRTQVTLGQAEPPDAWASLFPFHKRSGAPWEERLGLCGDLLARSPREGHCVVWTAFEHALLEGMVLTVGNVTFFDGGWALAVAREELSQEREVPLLAELEGDVWLPDVDDRTDLVIARVDLGHRPTTGAMEQAAEVARAMMAAASFRASGPSWREFGWSQLILDGRSSASSSFAPEHQVDSWGMNRFAARRTAAELERLTKEPGVMDVGNSSGQKPLDAARWLAAAEKAEPAAAIVLYVRVLELIASWLDLDTGWDLTSEFLRDSWSFDVTRNDLFNATLAGLDEARAAAKHADRAANLRNGLLETSSDGMVWLQLRLAVQSLDEIRLMIPAQSMQDRFLAEVQLGLSTGHALCDRIEELRKRFDLLKARLKRTRDAITHGNPAPAATCESVLGFARTLASAAVGLTVQAVLSGEGYGDPFARLREQNWHALELLKGGGSPVDVLTQNDS